MTNKLKARMKDFCRRCMSDITAIFVPIDMLHYLEYAAVFCGVIRSYKLGSKHICLTYIGCDDSNDDVYVE